MKYLLILFVSLILTSCRITTGYYYSGSYIRPISPVVPIITPPIYTTPYYFTPYRPRTWYYTPRPRTNIIINQPNYNRNSGPRGGRRK